MAVNITFLEGFFQDLVCTASSNCTGKSVTHFTWCRAGHSASGHMHVSTEGEGVLLLSTLPQPCVHSSKYLLCAALLCYSEHAATLLTSHGIVQDTFQAGKGSPFYPACTVTNCAALLCYSEHAATLTIKLGLSMLHQITFQTQKL